MAVSLDTSCKTLTCAMVSSICLDEVLRGDGEGRVFNRLKGRVLQKNQENGPESILKNSKAVNLNDIKGIVANCPGISGTVPNFLPVSRKGPENLL